MSEYKLVAKRLKEARIVTGLSQRRLGIEAGIDEFSASARMNQYETGKHQPDLSSAKRICAVLGVPVSFLYCVEDDLALLNKVFYKLSAEDKAALLKIASKY
ncbi:helix-turn-helix domain-containing protein [Marinospirillum insulare]|uniref:Transcriptional regulator n=1 Tax=Marinospirillum insulare TaxID=217169 RepID=A0ABQ5ZXP0_9GAMM|nr:helix-turn-helix transcriptional regulator [Marinospirillum insulare]GLR64217.1 transcriptional regulator [Marinospirillum insulare]